MPQILNLPQVFPTCSQVTGAVGWRRNGIRYKKNEVFLDIVETVNVLLNSKGDVLRSEVIGKMHMKARPHAVAPRLGAPIIMRRGGKCVCSHEAERSTQCP